jgi:deazaflavin-dependent oxidoreductase (nitroreductase family)
MALDTKRYYNRPSRVRIRVYDPLIRRIVQRFGWFQVRGGTLRVLAVRGRRSNRWYHHPVGVCTVDGQRYVISFYGDSQWARNLRAGAEAALHARGRAEPVRAFELAGGDKRAFMEMLVRRYPAIVRVWWKVSAPELTADEMNLLIARYPVFRIAPAETLPSAAPHDK